MGKIEAKIVQFFALTCELSGDFKRESFCGKKHAADFLTRNAIKVNQPGKPEKPTFLDQEKNMTRKTRKICCYSPWPSWLRPNFSGGSTGVQGDAVFWTRQEFCNNSPKIAQN